MIILRPTLSTSRFMNRQTNSRTIIAALSTNKTIIASEPNDKGVIILNKPKALNAIDLDMVRQIYSHLKRWENTKSAVIIKAVGGKSFCAGGDARSVAEAGSVERSSAFFREGYPLNALIGNYKIPYIALIDGITMGGGAGLAVNGKYRVATERTVFAMPETQIGLFPDAGGSHFLSRLPGKIGMYLGLTGSRLKGEDVTKVGVATHYCRSEQLGQLEEALIIAKRDEIDAVLAKFNKISSSEFGLAKNIDQINNHFSKASVEEIVQSLKSDSSEWAQKTLQTLMRMSPTSLKVTHKELIHGAKMSLVDCLKMEYRMAVRFMEKSDLREGVRALLIDKDQKPKWNPATLEAVTDSHVQFYFQPLAANEELKL